MYNQNSKLVDFNILYDARNKQYYFEAKYEVKEKDGKHVVCCEIPVFVYDRMPDVTVACGITTVDFGFGEISIFGDVRVEDRLVKPRVEKMTIADIEKELGYKIEIVGERKK